MQNIKKFIRLAAIAWSYVVLLLAATVIEALVFMFLWNCFVVTLGCPAIGVLQAVGLTILLDFLTFRYQDYKKDENAGVLDAFKYIFIRPAVSLFFGLIVYLLQQIL